MVSNLFGIQSRHLTLIQNINTDSSKEKNLTDGKDCYNLEIKMSSGKSFTINYHPSDTIKKLKSRIYIEKQIPPHHQILKFEGNILYEEALLKGVYADVTSSTTAATASHPPIDLSILKSKKIIWTTETKDEKAFIKIDK